MALTPAHASELYSSLLVVVIALGAYFLVRRQKAPSA